MYQGYRSVTGGRLLPVVECVQNSAADRRLGIQPDCGHIRRVTHMFAKSVVAVCRMSTCAELVPILRTTLDRRPLATRLDVMSPITFFLLAAWWAVLSVIDMQQRRLPNVLTGWGALIVLGYALFTTQFTAAVVGAALLVVPYLLVHLAVPAAFGAGDVKLAVGLGATAALGGAQAWVWAAVAAPVLTAGGARRGPFTPGVRGGGAAT